MKNTFSLLKKLAFLSLAVFAFSGSIANAKYPDKPISLMVAYNPGGATDFQARIVSMMAAHPKKNYLGQPIVVINKPGAGGKVGWNWFATKAKKNGYDLAAYNIPHFISQSIVVKGVKYNTKNLEPIANWGADPAVLIVGKDSPFNSVKDLLDFAKKNPGKLTFSGSGTYSANHLLTIALNQKANIKTTYVPFKGTGAAVQALLGKQVVAEAGYSTVAAKQGSKVRMLAVASEKRLPAFPNVPTFKELGYDIVSGAYRGYALPKSASAATVKTWSDRIMKINADPSFKKKMEDGAFVVVNIGHDKIKGFMAEQKKANEKIAKELGLIK